MYGNRLNINIFPKRRLPCSVFCLSLLFSENLCNEINGLHFGPRIRFGVFFSVWEKLRRKIHTHNTLYRQSWLKLGKIVNLVNKSHHAQLQYSKAFSLFLFLRKKRQKWKSPLSSIHITTQKVNATLQNCLYVSTNPFFV